MVKFFQRGKKEEEAEEAEEAEGRKAVGSRRSAVGSR